jgi:HD-like signal output (HDOD) protein
VASSPAELARSVSQVGSVHRLYHRLAEVISHPFSSAVDIGKVISEDPDLTARLLRLVNSPIYGFPGRIATVTQAITVVGINQLQDLALGASFIRAFGAVPQDLVSMDGFWRHSIACAVGARSLALQRREPTWSAFSSRVCCTTSADRCSTSACRTSRTAPWSCRATGELLAGVETELLGFHHGHVGGALLEHWRLPSLLQEAVAWHHSPRHAARYPVEAAVIHVADHLANAFALGTSGERLVPALLPDAWDRLGISTGVLATVLYELEPQYRAAVAAILGGSE